MTTTITPTRNQSSHCNVTTRKSFNLGCNSGLWAYDVDINQAKTFCSTVCSNLCPNIGGEEPRAVNFTSGSNQPRISPVLSWPIKCTYDLDQFRTIEDVEIYREAFTKDGVLDNALIDIIGPKFCLCKIPNQSTFSTEGQSEGEGCPIDPNTNQRMPKCSNMVSSDTKLFTFCQDWQNAVNEATFNNLATNYCSQFNTPDCTCINCLNTTDQPICSAIASEIPGTESCWWAPCKKGSNNIYIQRKGAECDNAITVCIQVNNIINNKNIKIRERDSRTLIDCNTDTKPPDIPNSRLKIVIIGILIIVVIIAVIAIAANRK